MGNQHLIFIKKEHEQSNKKNSITTNPVLSPRGEARGMQKNLSLTMKLEKNKSLDPAGFAAGRQYRSEQLQNSVNKTSDELENYRNFFKLIASDNDMDLDEIVDVNENTQTIKGGFHGR